MPEVAIVEVGSAEQLEQALAIRLAVFVEEQGVRRELEIDGRDDAARHLLALRDGAPVGTLRVRWLDAGRTAKIERVAVFAGARGSKVGQALLQAALALGRVGGRARGEPPCPDQGTGFYGKLGFVAFGPEFMEDGIAHIAMRLSLSADGTGRSSADRHSPRASSSEHRSRLAEREPPP